jgi:hypothetical protein
METSSRPSILNCAVLSKNQFPINKQISGKEIKSL